MMKRGSRLGELAAGGKELPGEAGVCDDCLSKNAVGQTQKDWEELANRKEIVQSHCSFESGFWNKAQAGAFFPQGLAPTSVCALLSGEAVTTQAVWCHGQQATWKDPGWWLSTPCTSGIPDPRPRADDGVQAAAQGISCTAQERSGR